MLALFSFIRSPFFSVSSIDIHGTSFLAPEEVMVLSGVSRGENIFEISPARVRARLMKNPRIGDVTVRRKLPSTVIIDIEERRPLLVVRYAGYFLEVDAEGYVLGVVETLKHSTLPILVGASIKTAEVGERIDAPGLEAVLSLAGAMSPGILARISQFHITGPGDVEAIMPEGIRVVFGSGAPEEMRRKALVLEAILGQAQGGGGDITYIDLRYAARPVIRERGTGRR